MSLLVTPTDEHAPIIRIKRAGSWDEDELDSVKTSPTRHLKKARLGDLKDQFFPSLVDSDSEDSEDHLDADRVDHVPRNPLKASATFDGIAKQLDFLESDALQKLLNETSFAPDHEANVFPRIVSLGRFNLFGFESCLLSVETLHLQDAEVYYDIFDKVPIFCSLKADKSIAVGDLISVTTGTPIGAIQLNRARLLYQNLPIDLTSEMGLSISATISVNDSHQELHDLLVGLLGVDEPELALYCNIPNLPDWKTPLSPGSFTFTASLDPIAIKPFEALTITSLALSIHCYTGFAPDKDGQMLPKSMYTYTVRGSMDIKLPLSEKSVETHFSLTKSESVYRFATSFAMDWQDAFGFAGLNLQGVGVTTQIDTKMGWKSASFGLGCQLMIADTIVEVGGQFSFQGDFEISFAMSHFSWDTIKVIHQQLFPDDSPLDTPDIALHIDYAQIRLCSRDGLIFHVGGLKIGDYLGASGTLAIGKRGGLFDIEVAGGILELGDFKITQARLTVEIDLGEKSPEAVAGSDKQYSLTVSGKAQWKSLHIAVGARLYKMAGTDGLQYTIYGDLSDAEGGFHLGDHIPGIDKTPLADIVIRKVMLLIASRSDNHPSLNLPPGYVVKRGLQLCVDIGACDTLAALFDEPELGLLMAVSWNPDLPCGVQALLKTTNLPKLRIGDEFETGDVELILGMTTLGPQLSLAATATLQLHGNKDKLKFKIVGVLDTIGVTITGIMEGNWHNPFDLCQSLTIGPKLELTLGVSYALTPTEFGFVGGMTIGKVRGDVAVKASKDPHKQLVSVACKNLELTDVFMLLDGESSPATPPDNIVTFRDLSIYICPFGTEEYPRGFMFNCNALFFDKEAWVNVKITNDGFTMFAQVDAFDIGPFRISGAEGPNAKLRGDLFLTASKKSGSLSGRISGAGLDCSVIGAFTFDPLMIAFRFDLDFFSLFTIKAALGPLPPTPGTVAKPAASLLDSGMRFEALYQDTHMGGFLAHLVREWRKALQADCEERRDRAAKKIAEDLDRGEIDFENLWDGMIGEVEGLAADLIAPLIEDILNAFYLSKIHVRTDIHPGMTGFTFQAEVAGAVLGEEFAFWIDFELKDIDQMIMSCIKKLKDKFVHLVEDIIEKITGELADKIGKLAEEVFAKLGKIVEEVAEAVIEVAEEIGEAVEELGEELDKAAEVVAEAMEEAVEEFAEGVEKAVDEIAQGAEDFANDVEDALSEFGSDVDDVVEDVGRGLEEVGGEIVSVAEDVGEAFESVGNTIGDFFGF